MKNFVFKLIDTFTDGSDFYEYNGHLWLIFTDEKKWVFELDKKGILWYNYHFFKDCFKYVSLDVVENQKYITEWVENTIQNGVKYTHQLYRLAPNEVENTIQNGVKYTCHQKIKLTKYVENTIQNGVRRTYIRNVDVESYVEDVIQNGDKHTLINIIKGLDSSEVTEKEISKIIKETHHDDYNHNERVKGVIRNGKIKYSDDLT